MRMLRLLVLLLLFFNIGYFTWGEGWLRAYGWGPTQQREPQRLAQQVHPEAIAVLSAGESTLAPKAQGAASAPAKQTCLLSGPLDETQAQALQPVLKSTLASDAWSLDEEVTPARWIVYMGRFTDRAELERKRGQLNDLKIKFEPVDVAELSPGLLLGSFSTQAASESALQALGKRGVRSAKTKQVRAATGSYRLRLPSLDTAALQAIKDALPGVALQPCPAPSAN